MYLSKITFRNWKGYQNAEVNFPEPHEDKNIVLIGAPNGFGKTSFFEGIVLALFGRQGLPLIARSPLTSEADDRLDTSYSKFLEGALHKAEGCRNANISLTFGSNDGDDSETVTISRTWHFNDARKFKQYDEEVKIFEGEARRLVGPETTDGEERREWFQNYVAKKFIPFYLASFFLFDGEEVGEFATSDMSDQVRRGIEGLLGIPILRDLSSDLEQYAKSKKQKSGNVSNREYEAQLSENEGLELLLKKTEVEISELASEIESKEQRRDSLTREITNSGHDSAADIQELAEKQGRLEEALRAEEAKFGNILTGDLPLALVGAKKRNGLKDRLTAERKRREWIAGKSQGDANLKKFLIGLNESLAGVEPQLREKQTKGVIKAVNSSWESLWYPEPEGMAEDLRHDYLDTDNLGLTLSKLNSLDQIGMRDLEASVKEQRIINENRKIVESKLRSLEETGPEFELKRGELIQINEGLSKLNQQKGSLVREKEAKKAQLDQGKIKLGRIVQQLDSTQPQIRRTLRAQKVIAAIENIIADAVPTQINAIKKAMSQAYAAISRKKGLVSTIEIDEDCKVSLLTRNGTDAKDFDLSAGEKQIFTQSLIYAVSTVSERAFPMLIDTPLARLDREHRLGVLNHLAKRKNQIILLSTNTEVVGESLAEIDDNIQAKFMLNWEQVSSELGVTTIHKGYFE